MTIRKAVIGTLVAALLLGIPESRAVTLNWDATASSGLWEPAANWGGTSPPGSEILVFDNNVQTSMTNDAVNTTRNQIIFNAGATTARTIGGSTANDFVAVGLDNPLLQNNSTGSHVLNFPISVGADGLTIDTVTAPLTLGGAVSGSGTVTKIGGLSTGGGIGNVVVSASNSGFTDKWNIEGGIFSINNDAALGAVPGSAVADAITLDGRVLANMTGAGSTVDWDDAFWGGDQSWTIVDVSGTAVGTAISSTRSRSARPWGSAAAESAARLADGGRPADQAGPAGPDGDDPRRIARGDRNHRVPDTTCGRWAGHGLLRPACNAAFARHPPERRGPKKCRGGVGVSARVPGMRR